MGSLSDGAVFLLIALILLIPSAAIQFLLCLFAKSRLIKALPAVITAIVWVICILGTFNIIDLPPTSTIVEGGFIAFPDYMVLAAAGVPVMLGFALGWGLDGIVKALKKKRSVR